MSITTENTLLFHLKKRKEKVSIKNEYVWETIFFKKIFIII